MALGAAADLLHGWCSREPESPPILFLIRAVELVFRPLPQPCLGFGQCWDLNYEVLLRVSVAGEELQQPR